MATYATAKPLLIVVMVRFCIWLELTAGSRIMVRPPTACLTDFFSGKSTVGSNLGADLSIPFIDGDALHPASNVAKMSAGTPLTDEDRLPWLQIIRETGELECKAQWDKVQAGELQPNRLGRPAVVIACSALKKYYRDILRGDVAATSNAVSWIQRKQTDSAQLPKMRTIFVYCCGTPELLAQRIAAREGHFMKPNMLASQLATLEDPSGEPGVVVVDISHTPVEVSRAALEGTQRVVAEMTARGE